MIYFSNILEALFYRSYCPFCNNPLASNNIVSTPLYTSKEVTYLMSDGNRLTVDCLSNRVEIIFYQKSFYESDFYQPPRVPAPPNYDGIMYESIEIGCYSCQNFYYVVRLKIDLSNMLLSEVSLNSETVIIRKGGEESHFIKNVYSFDQTEYSYMTYKRQQQIKLPLIPLNLDNVQETLDRIKKLLVFS